MKKAFIIPRKIFKFYGQKSHFKASTVASTGIFGFWWICRWKDIEEKKESRNLSPKFVPLRSRQWAKRALLSTQFDTNKDINLQFFCHQRIHKNRRWTFFLPQNYKKCSRIHSCVWDDMKDEIWRKFDTFLSMDFLRRGKRKMRRQRKTARKVTYDVREDCANILWKCEKNWRLKWIFKDRGLKDLFVLTLGNLKKFKVI